MAIKTEVMTFNSPWHLKNYRHITRSTARM